MSTRLRKHGHRTINAGELAKFIEAKCSDGARVYVATAGDEGVRKRVVNATLDVSHTGRPILVINLE